MASINPSVLDCRYSPHVSGKTDNRCRITITEITQDTNANTTHCRLHSSKGQGLRYNKDKRRG